MAMRSQMYEWCNIAGNGRRVAGDDAVGSIPLNTQVDIFTGGIGNNIEKTPYILPHQFVVIDKMSCSVGNTGFVQLIIDTTRYFQNPDKSGQVGVPGFASPYPIGDNPENINPDTDNDNHEATYNSFEFNPPAYVFPGQNWTITYRPYSALVGTGYGVAAFVKYTLYDGADSLIANKLAQMSISITPDNVDWYKRTLIEQNNVLHNL